MHPDEPDDDTEATPQRRVVLHPRTAAARRHGRARARGGFVRGHPVDDAEVLRLIARQRRVAFGSAVLLLVPLFSVPALLWLADEVASARPLGVPSLAWLILSPGFFPLFVVLGRRHERRASTVEQEWVEDQQASSSGWSGGGG